MQRTTQLIYGIYDKEYYSQYDVEVVISRFFFCEEEVPAAITGWVFRLYGWAFGFHHTKVLLHCLSG